MKKLLTPSVAVFPGSLEEAALVLNTIGCERVHVDIVAGNRIGDLLIGSDFTQAARTLFRGSVDLHLFELFGGEPYVPPLRSGDRVIFHVFPWMMASAVTAAVERLSNGEAEVGLALDLETPLAEILSYLELLSTIIVMGIPVGGRRLPLDERAPRTIGAIRKTPQSKPTQLSIGIDGGVNEQTFERLAMITDFLVVGGILFDAQDLGAKWRSLNQRLREVNARGENPP